MNTLKSGAKLKCPHCNEELEGVVDDYVVPGNLGLIQPTNKNDCGWCNRLFTVKRLRDSEFEIQKISGSV
jgi:ribosomal protein L34E